MYREYDGRLCIVLSRGGQSAAGPPPRVRPRHAAGAKATVPRPSGRAGISFATPDQDSDREQRTGDRLKTASPASLTAASVKRLYHACITERRVRHGPSGRTVVPDLTTPGQGHPGTGYSGGFGCGRGRYVSGLDAATVGPRRAVPRPARTQRRARCPSSRSDARAIAMAERAARPGAR